jgi:single-strand DNA-binding protein
MSLNKLMLIGHVGKDPDIRILEAGSKVATEKGYTLANGTQVPERTEWHNIVVWRGLADVVEKYVHKGDKLYLEGKIRTRSYDDSRGIKRYITELFVDNMEMLSVKPQQAPPPRNTPIIRLEVR